MKGVVVLDRVNLNVPASIQCLQPSKAKMTSVQEFKKRKTQDLKRRTNGLVVESDDVGHSGARVLNLNSAIPVKGRENERSVLVHVVHSVGEDDNLFVHEQSKVKCFVQVSNDSRYY